MAKRRMTVQAVVFDPLGRVLLVRQGKRRRGRWELPGGHVRKRESLAQACRREVAEETGLAVEPVGVVGLFFVRDERTHDAVLLCRLPADDPVPGPRANDVAAAEFFATDRLPEPVRPFTADRIADAVAGTGQALPVEITAAEWV